MEIFSALFVLEFLVICPEVTCKTNQKSVRQSVHLGNVNIFITLRLRDHWVELGETWLVFSVGPETKLRKRNFEFQPLRRAGEMTHHEWGDYFVHEHVRPCDVELCQFLTTKCDCRMI